MSTENSEILKKLLEVDNIPTLPEVVDRVLEIVEDRSSSAKDLTEVLECDHAISARILRMANSAFYGLTNRVETIRRAVVVLGFDTVRLLAMATSVFDTLSKRQQFALDPDDFWMHSLGAAKAARLLSKRCIEPVNAGAAFTAGLLHDVGKYLLALVLGTEYRKIVQEAEEGQTSLFMAERNALRTTHDRIGAWLAEKWRFPKSVTATIRYFREAASFVGSHRAQIAIVNLSDNLSRAAGFGCAGDYDRPELEPKCLRLIGLRQPMEDLVQELQPYIENAKELIHILR